MSLIFCDFHDVWVDKTIGRLIITRKLGSSFSDVAVDGPIRSIEPNVRRWRHHVFFFNWVLRHHFGSQNTRQTAAHTSTLFRGLAMVHTCVVAGCRNRRTPGTTLSFYRFPRDPERKQRWIAAVNREGWVPNDGSRLCSSHFISGMGAVKEAHFLLKFSVYIYKFSLSLKRLYSWSKVNAINTVMVRSNFLNCQ